MQLPIVGEAYSSRDDKQDTVNMYPEVNPTKQVEVLLGCPGKVLFSDNGAAPCRGLHIVSKNETRLYSVHGRKVWSNYNNGYSEVIGEIGTDEGLVSIADNGFEVVICDGSPVGYIYDIAGKTFNRISGFPGGQAIVFIDGYFITVTPDSQRLWSSGLYDGNTWNALDVAEAEGDPDNISSISTNHKELFIHGILSSEIWANAGYATGFPFARMQGGIVEYGLAAKNSVVRINNNIYMMARTDKGERVIIQISGYQPSIISTPGINYLLSLVPNTADFEAIAYTQEGHSFIVFSSTVGDLTIVFDTSTGKWHRRKSFGMGRWRSRCYAFFNNKHIVGDIQNGKLYELRMDKYSDDGDTIERIRIAQEIIDKEDNDRIFIHELQLDMELGLGNDEVTNPVAVLQTSKDNGKTWGPDHVQPLMKKGEFRRRLMWHRLGMGRRRLFKLTITDPVSVVIRGAWITAEKGKS